MSDRELSIRREVELPPELVDDVMVPRAERNQIVEISPSAEFKRKHVVNLALPEGHVAVAKTTAAIHRTQCPTLCPVGEPLRATQVQWHAVYAKDDRRDAPVAAEPAYGLWRQWHTLIGFAHAGIVKPFDDRALVGDDEHVCFDRTAGLVAAGDQDLECVGGELSAVDAAIT